MPRTWDLGHPTPGGRYAIGTGLGRRDLALLYNVSAEFAYSLDRRSLADRARSAVFSSVPDAVLVSGAITGEAAAMSDLEAVKRALPDTPVLANTGVKHATVADVLRGGGRVHRRLVAEGRRRHLERRWTRSAPPTSWPGYGRRDEGAHRRLDPRADAGAGAQRSRGPGAPADRGGARQAGGRAFDRRARQPGRDAAGASRGRR